MKKGIDAPITPLMFIICGSAGLVAVMHSDNYVNYVFPVLMIILSIIYLHTSLIGKYRIIQHVVEKLEIPSTSQILDLGTGHGAVLLTVTQRLSVPGKVIGIDIWNSVDQSNNSRLVTQQNIDQLGLNDVARLQTADMTSLPFQDNYFDYVFASLAIHNVKPKAQRRLAIEEAMRILKNNGQLVIIDIEHIQEYQKWLSELGCNDVQVYSAGWDGLWGWLPTKILIAKKNAG